MAPSKTTSTVLVSQRHQDDLAFSKSFHGHTWDEAHHQDTFVSKLIKKDREFQPELVDNYLKNWKHEDPIQETAEEKEARQNAYRVVTNSFYDLATDFYEVQGYENLELELK
ncbi:Delta(24)-sterol C-methyltransferase, partial [Haplosporangium bisporale]